MPSFQVPSRHHHKRRQTSSRRGGFQKLLKAEAYRRVRMYNLQSAKKLCLGRNLTGDSTCPSTRDGERKTEQGRFCMSQFLRTDQEFMWSCLLWKSMRLRLRPTGAGWAPTICPRPTTSHSESRRTHDSCRTVYAAAPVRSVAII